MTNLGTCLATARTSWPQQGPDAILRQPQLITLSVGPNDLRQGRGPDDFARRVEIIIERLDRETNAAVILNALPDLASAPRFRQPERSMVAALTRHYNHALRHVADGFGVDLVDLEIGERPERELRRLFSEDGYHPSNAGYAAWAGVLWDAVRTRIPDQTRLTATPA